MLRQLVFIVVLILVYSSSLFSQSIYSVAPEYTNQSDIAEVLLIDGDATHFTEIYVATQVKLVNGSTEIFADELLFIPPELNDFLEITFSFSQTNPLGYYDLYITTDSDGEMVLQNAFYIYPFDNQSEIIEVSPSIGAQGTSLSVSIIGNHTHFGANGFVPQVFFTQGSNTIYCDEFIVENLTSIHAEMSFTNEDPIGLYDVSVYNNIDATVTKLQSFYLQQNPDGPQIINVNPEQALQGTTLDVTVTTQGTTFSQASGTVWFTQGSETAIYPDNVTVEDSETIQGTFAIGQSPLGYYNVHTSSAEGELILPNGFEVIYNPDMPTIVDITPDNAEQGQTLNITITGENTHFNQGSGTPQVWFSQASGTVIYPNNTQENSDTELESEFTFTYGDATGYYNVYVDSDVDGLLTQIDGFYLDAGNNPPAISSVYPNQACVNESLQVQISCSNTQFMQATSSIDAWLYNNSGTYISSSSVNAQSNQQITAIFNFTSSDPEGYYHLALWSDVSGYLIYENAVELMHPPATPDFINGLTSLCVNSPNTEYELDYSNPDYNYNWMLLPDEAGSINNLGIPQISVDWNDDFTGTAQLMVNASNECGESLYAPLEINISENPTVAEFYYYNLGSNVIGFDNNSQNANEFLWDFGDGETSNLFNPIHAYIEEGSYLVTLESSGGTCGYDVYQIEIIVNYIVSINDHIKNTFSIYPNPVNKILNFSDYANKVSVYNTQAQLVMSDEFVNSVSFESLPSGIYIIKLDVNNHTIIKRIVRN